MGDRVQTFRVDHRISRCKCRHREIDPVDPDPGTSIVVDLGRFDKVDYVYVNGTKMEHYTLDGYKLTVNLKNKTATSLTIGVKNDDGTISAQTYKLTYKEGYGYTAQRVYGTNDAAKPVRGIWEKIVDFFKSIFEKIKALFK